jgi:hypothetical protein
MPLNPPNPIPSSVARQSLYQSLVLALCILFGLAAIANTQIASDGGWMWYAVFLHSGQRLYSGMHLALQPLFVLETSASIALFGKGWLLSKIPAALHLVAYCFGLSLIARSSNLSDRQKALVLACVFFVSIDFVAYRFDDYHVLADCFQIYSLVTLLALRKSSSLARSVGLATVLAVLSGLALMTRLNDGAALMLGVAIAILFLAPSRRLLSLFLFAAFAALTVVLVVHLTGDSLHDWATYSIFKAAGSKGGAGNILAYPLQLPRNALHFLARLTTLTLLVCFFGIALVWVFLIRPFFLTRAPGNLLKLLAGVALILLPFLWLGYHLVDSFPVLAFPPLGVLLAYALGLAVVLRTLGQKFLADTAHPWNPREILLLIPLGQLASGSMSSGGSPLGLNGPLAIILLLLPIASPIRLKREAARAYAFALLGLLALDGAAFKYRVPFQWHSYTAAPMFTARQWYHHPDYGPMVIERDQFAFIQPICSAVQADGAQQGLLSLPYPFPNYFCSIPPWHGYVQTFYDTSTRQTIQALTAELQTEPPKWIVYQRQPYNMSLHEQIFNHNQPLPHRALDQLIEDKLASGTWQPVYTTTYGSNNPFADQWTLIRTRP